MLLISLGRCSCLANILDAIKLSGASPEGFPGRRCLSQRLHVTVAMVFQTACWETALFRRKSWLELPCCILTGLGERLLLVLTKANRRTWFLQKTNYNLDCGFISISLCTPSPPTSHAGFAFLDVSGLLNSVCPVYVWCLQRQEKGMKFSRLELWMVVGHQIGAVN